MKPTKVYKLTENQLYEIFKAGFDVSQSKQDCETIFDVRIRYMYPFMHKEDNLNNNNFKQKKTKQWQN